MTVPTRPRLAALLLMLVALVGALSGCGGSGGDDDEPDEDTFCRLARVNEPVAEADAVVLRRLDELAPPAVDAAVDVLREAAEELEEATPGSDDAIALEFEIRFREDYLAAREQVETFIAAECEREPEAGDDDEEEAVVPGDGGDVDKRDEKGSGAES
ncbi:MAG: hypothetical protein U5K29_11030 [Acidimicrobiales bacterium]|nr:hypothetical protein [Acidimicrobiales bacterium]